MNSICVNRCIFEVDKEKNQMPPRHVPPKNCANPYFTEKWRCLSSVSLFFCRKALGLLTSSPLPSFLLSEGTHLKNENKVIVPVLFLKSLQMLSVDGRLIVRRVAVRAGGRKRRHRYNSSSCSSTSATASQKTHSAGKFYTHTYTHTLLCCSLTQTHTYMALTGILARRGFSFNGLFGMHGVAKYELGSLHNAP